MTGYAFPGVEIRVVDANDNDVPRDGQSIGEMSRGVMAYGGVTASARASAEALRGWLVHTETWHAHEEVLAALLSARKTHRQRRRDSLLELADGLPSRARRYR